MVVRQAEGVGMRAQGKPRAHGNYKAGRARVNQRARKEDKEDVKITDVPYINGYVENQVKPVNEDSLSLQSAGLTRAASS